MQPLVNYEYKSVDWALLRYMDIEDATRRTHVYLRRLIIFKTPLCAIYVHWIYVPDSDRDPHNHPMDFISVVLKGGYEEKRWISNHDIPVGGIPTVGVKFMKRTRGLFTAALTRRANFHSITRLHDNPTVTLLFCGPRSKDGWGFMTPEGFVHQKEYRRS